MCKGRATGGGLNTLAQQRPSGGAYQHLRNLGPSMLAECSMIFNVCHPVFSIFKIFRAPNLVSKAQPWMQRACPGPGPRNLNGHGPWDF